MSVGPGWLNLAECSNHDLTQWPPRVCLFPIPLGLDTPNPHILNGHTDKGSKQLPTVELGLKARKRDGRPSIRRQRTHGLSSLPTRSSIYWTRKHLMIENHKEVVRHFYIGYCSSSHCFCFYDIWRRNWESRAIQVTIVSLSHAIRLLRSFMLSNSWFNQVGKDQLVTR